MSAARVLLLAGASLMLLAAATAARADAYGDVQRLLGTQRLQEAQAQAEQYLAGHPRDPQMRYLLGRIQLETGRSEEALQIFTRLTEDFPELPEPYNALAVIHAAHGDYEQARLALQAALRNNPAYAAALENLGDVHAALARQAYCKARQLEPGNTAIAAKLERLGSSFSCP
jgi:Flp pilus assembly protein TadD